MDNVNLLDLPERKKYLESGQKLFIFGVMLVLGIFAFFRPPQIFKTAFKSESKVPSKYYAYVEPQAGPQIAGASTAGEGPSILNDDGTFSPAVDTGSVLGLDTGDIAPLLANIKLSTISASGTTVQTYLDQVDITQDTFINQQEFQNALVSNNAELVKLQSERVNALIKTLLSMVVPKDAERYHKLVVLQYQAGLKLMQNYSQLDKNPQLVNQQLGLFIQTQQEQSDERVALMQKYNIQ